MFEPSSKFQKIYETSDESDITRYIQEMKKKGEASLPQLQFFLDPLNLQTDWRAWKHLQFDRIVGTWRHLERKLTENLRPHEAPNQSLGGKDAPDKSTSAKGKTTDKESHITPVPEIQTTSAKVNETGSPIIDNKTLDTSMMVNKFTIGASPSAYEERIRTPNGQTRSRYVSSARVHHHMHRG